MTRAMAIAALMTATGYVAVQAQDPVQAPPRLPGASSQAKIVKPLVPLKITVVIARFQGQKRTGNLPFEMIVNADGDSTSLQMGADVPYAQTAFVPGPEAKAEVRQVSYTFRPIGTNINCSAVTTDDGRFKVVLTVLDSQIFNDPLPGTSPALSGVPSFQSFTSNSQLILRDGQTIQYNTAVDKATGEQIKLDVTLNVLK
jgi:hypothetical protein